jgi:hypothetical protein
MPSVTLSSNYRNAIADFFSLTNYASLVEYYEVTNGVTD